MTRPYFIPQETNPVPIGQEAEWAPEPVNKHLFDLITQIVKLGKLSYL
jgi:hypothetical protein